MSWPTSTDPAPATARRRRSTAGSSTCAAPPSASATSPTTSPDHSWRPAASDPNYTLVREEPHTPVARRCPRLSHVPERWCVHATRHPPNETPIGQAIPRAGRLTSADARHLSPEGTGTGNSGATRGIAGTCGCAVTCGYAKVPVQRLSAARVQVPPRTRSLQASDLRQRGQGPLSLLLREHRGDSRRGERRHGNPISGRDYFLCPPGRWPETSGVQASTVVPLIASGRALPTTLGDYPRRPSPTSSAISLTPHSSEPPSMSQDEGSLARGTSGACS